VRTRRSRLNCNRTSTMADSCAPCGTVNIHPGAHAPVQAGSWSGRPVGELGRLNVSAKHKPGRCCQRQTCAERSLVATCFVHHDGRKDGGLQEERLSPTNRFAETKLACSRRTQLRSCTDPPRFTPRCPSCSGRRVAVWSGVCSSRPSGFGEAARRASSLRTWRWRVRRSPCPSSPTTHPPYVPRSSAVDHTLIETC
jgi:hypothetical protein